MPRVQLSGGAYEARSLIAAAQRSLNLYAEPMPQDQGEPSTFAYYPTPGLRLLGTMPSKASVRGMKFCSNGTLYVVAGAEVYYVTQTWTGARIGSITVGRTTPVGMAENGLNLVIVDGTGVGWSVTLATNAFAQITDPVFRGGDAVWYLDTYLVNNVPGTPQFQSSDSLAITYDPLWFANKESFSDLLMTLAVAKREIWLIGQQATEIWYNAGTPDFPFGAQQGIFIPHGIAAIYSVATVDNAVYWLSRTREGQGIVISGAGYQARRISTFAIEVAINRYSTISDAVGYTYQMAGHMWYALAFPSADKTWCYDVSTGQWHELAWLDSNGVEHRHRANCACEAYGEVVCGDWQNGNLYALDLSVSDDNGQAIKRVRSYPHLLNNSKRVFYKQFLADIEAGNPGSDSFFPTPGDDFAREDGTLFLREDGADLLREASRTDALLSLRWSDDRGHTYGNSVTELAGNTGQYLTSLQWQRLGMARDRVFEISWSITGMRALQGAWVDVATGAS